MGNNFEYKIHISIDQNSVKTDVRKALADMAKEIKNNAYQIELTGNPNDLLQQILELQKKVPEFDLTSKLHFSLSDALRENTDEGKKVLNEFIAWMSNAINDSLSNVVKLQEEISKTKAVIDELTKKKKSLGVDQKGVADPVKALRNAEAKLSSYNLVDKNGATLTQNKTKILEAYQTVIDIQESTGQELSEGTKALKKQIEDIFNVDLSNVHMKKTYQQYVDQVLGDMLAAENKIRELNKNLQDAQNPQLNIKGKLADNFLVDLQSQLDQMEGLKVKVTPKVDKDVKLEVEVEEDVKPPEIPNQNADEIVEDSETAIKNFERLNRQVENYKKAKADQRLADPSIVTKRKGRGLENIKLNETTQEVNEVAEADSDTNTESQVSQLEREFEAREKNVQAINSQAEAEKALKTSSLNTSNIGEIEKQTEALAHEEQQIKETTNAKEALELYEDSSGQLSLFEHEIEVKQKDIEVTNELAEANKRLNDIPGQMTIDDYEFAPEDLSNNLDGVINKFKELGVSLPDVRKLLQGDSVSLSWIGKTGDQQRNISRLIELLKQLGLEVKAVGNSESLDTTITARTEAQVRSFEQEKQAVVETKEAVEELILDLDNLANHPFPTDDIFTNQKIAAEQSLRRLENILPENYDGEVNQQINELRLELSQLTEDDGLSSWASKFKIVADNVKTVNNEVKALSDNLKNAKGDYSFGLDKSIKVKELDKYRNKLKELGLNSDETENRIAALYETLGSAKDKTDLSIYSKELKLMQNDLAEQVQIRQRAVSVKDNTNAMQRKIDLLNLQYELEVKLAKTNPDKDPNTYKIYTDEISKIKKTVSEIILSQEQEAQVAEKTAKRRIAAETAVTAAKKKQTDDNKKENDKQAKSDEQLEKRRTTLLKKISSLMLNGQIMKSSGNRIKNYFDILQSEGGRSIDTLNKIEKEMNEIEIRARSTGQTGQTMFQLLQQRWQSLVAYLGSFASFYKIIDYARRAATVVKEFDDALTEMRKVSDESVTTLKAFQIESFNIATQVGSTAKVIQDSTADWMRLGRVKTLAPLYSNIY